MLDAHLVQAWKLGYEYGLLEAETRYAAKHAHSTPPPVSAVPFDAESGNVVDLGTVRGGRRRRSG